MQLAIGPLADLAISTVPRWTIIRACQARPENSHIWRHLRLCRRLCRPARFAGRAA